jgi:ABC-type multidrug transport system fused ATPase/permease subunit
MSLAENIRYGNPDATLEEIQAACRVANIHDFIMGLEKQYDTQVGEKGRELSGGQRQRIAIARAMAKKPIVLLLDEATAALDNVNEAEVQQALDNVISSFNMTVVSIAHRLSSIQNAKYIAVLHNGHVLEYGTHEQLYVMGGEYRTRYDMYFAQTP